MGRGARGYRRGCSRRSKLGRGFAAIAVISTLAVLASPAPGQEPAADAHSEVQRDPYLPGTGVPPETYIERSGPVVRGRFSSVQVNVNAAGENTPGDAANEPSIAIDPNNPDVIVIGWRQFDSIQSNFRQAGYAYSHDRGQSWTAGVLQPGQFRSDPVLDSDAAGNIYYYSLSTVTSCEMFISPDGGVSWTGPIPARGGDKAWMVVDKSAGIGDGHVYATWNRVFSCCNGDFTRSIDAGLSYLNPIQIPTFPYWGTMAVDATGVLYVVGVNPGFPSGAATIARSSNARNPMTTPTFTFANAVDIGGPLRVGLGPNPAGLLGQIWIAVDPSSGPGSGNLYMLASVDPPGGDRLDVMFTRSEDEGVTWSPPMRINDDPLDNGAWQWFGTLSVAPNGRIDAIWNDTRGSSDVRLSETYYSYSIDQGQTWSANVPVTPVFNSYLGFPRQNKLGDYYHMISDDQGASLAYAATFNGEQDVYFLRIGFDCDGNDLADEDEIAGDPGLDCNGNLLLDFCEVRDGTVEDCDANAVPDGCDPDTDGDGSIDACDNCPADANDDQADGDFDGVGDVCDPCPVDRFDDRDGDGYCDSDEQCPFDPAKSEPGQCGCGVPDDDSDGDTVPDCVDVCAEVDDLVFGPGCVVAIPTASGWGLAVLALMLVCVAKVSRRRYPG